jgi:hypothetical protein
MTALLAALALLASDEGGVVWTCITGTGLDDQIDAMTIDSAGRIVAVGRTGVTSENTDGWILLVDSGRGAIQWQKTLGGPGRDEFLDIAVVDSCYLAVGRTNSTGNGDYDLWAVLFDQEGNCLWQKTAGGSLEDEGTSVVAVPGSGAVAAGYTWSEGSGGSDLWMVRLARNGDIEWSRMFGGLGQEKAFCAILADSGTVVAGGVTYSFSSVSGDAYIVACDLWGQEIWSTYRGGSGYDFAMDLAPVQGGGLTAACWSKRTTCAVWAFALDGSGQFLSDWVASTMSDLRVEAMEPMPGGGWAVAGTTEDPVSGDRNIFTWLLSDSMDALWSETTGGPADEFCTDALVLPDGSIVVCGAADTEDKDNQGWLVCLRPALPADGEDAE